MHTLLRALRQRQPPQPSYARVVGNVRDLNKQAMQRLQTYIVEDSPVIRDSLIATLEELAPVSVVGVAEDQTTATQWLADSSHRAALVIIDIFLKGGSGLGVLQACAGARPGRKMVVLSNYATPDMRRKCLDLGADRVFDKSTEIDALIAYCERLATGGAIDSVPAALV